MTLNICSVLFSKGKTTGLILEELGKGDVSIHLVCKENPLFETFWIFQNYERKKIIALIETYASWLLSSLILRELFVPHDFGKN